MPSSGKILVGMGGWDLFPFDGVFYPAKRHRGFRKLEYYSRFFDFVEINSTFYNTSFSPGQVQRWLRDVSSNKDFIFAVKLFKGFTHSLDATKRDVSNVSDLLDAIAAGGRLAGLLIQFPYSFTNTHERQLYLVRLCKAFKSHNLLIEVRHSSWRGPLVGKLLEDNDAQLVNVDLPAMKRHVPFGSTSSEQIAYFRMMGRNTRTWDHPWRIGQDGKHIVSDRYNYFYTRPEIEQLADQIRKLSPRPARTFVVFHNDPEAHSLVNGFQLRRILMPGHPMVLPENLVWAFPELGEIGTAAREIPSLFEAG